MEGTTMVKKETTLSKLIKGGKVDTEQTTPTEQTTSTPTAQTTFKAFVVCKAGRGSIIDYSTDTLIRVTEGQTIELTIDTINGLFGKQTTSFFQSFVLPKQFCFTLNVTPKNTALLIARKSNPSRFLLGSYTRDGRDQCLIAERLMSQDKAQALLGDVFIIKMEPKKSFCRAKLAGVDFAEKETQVVMSKLNETIINQ
jgi:hypothetical protein